MDWLSLIQWPAMLITVAAAWLAGAQDPTRRKIGFWCFTAGNVLWIAWGWPEEAWALIVLQVALFGMNVRGIRKNEARED